jgi:CspA family cold shock protein
MLPPHEISVSSGKWGLTLLFAYRRAAAYTSWIRLRQTDVSCLVKHATLQYFVEFGVLRTVRKSFADDRNDKESDSNMSVGTVKWFNSVKGYGFISPDDGSKDAFVHISAVERAGLPDLAEGQRVEYELQPGKNGKSSAENLVLVE